MGFLGGGGGFLGRLVCVLGVLGEVLGEPLGCFGGALGVFLVTPEGFGSPFGVYGADFGGLEALFLKTCDFMKNLVFTMVFH